MEITDPVYIGYIDALDLKFGLEDAIKQSWICRVLRKFNYSSSRTFYDIVFALETTHEEYVTEWGKEESQFVFGSLMVDLGGRKEPAQARIPIAIGDILAVNGIIYNPDTCFVEKTERVWIRSRPNDIQVIEPFPLATSNFYSFDPEKVKLNFNDRSPVFLPVPQVMLQCRFRFVERVLIALQPFLTAHRYSVRESSTGDVESCDRLLILNPIVDTESGEGQSSRDHMELINQLGNDSTIGPAIMRVYTGQVQGMLACSIHALLSTALSELVGMLLQQQAVEKPMVVRLQSYPKKAVMTVISLFEGIPAAQCLFKWSPTNYTHVLSVCQCDGLWVVSLVPADRVFIGDLREKSKKHNPADNGSLAICRAGGKIEEALKRIQWLHDDTDCSKLHVYQLAVDIGAAPGGWSHFLSTQASVAKVIGIDKGTLTVPEPWPRQLEHWQMLGDEAISRLKQMKEDNTLQSLIDLLCCDANIPPEVTVQMMLKCVEYELLAIGARCVITFKQTQRKKLEWEESIATCLQQLNENGFPDIKREHLLANTARETTIFAVYAGKE